MLNLHKVQAKTSFQTPRGGQQTLGDPDDPGGQQEGFFEVLGYDSFVNAGFVTAPCAPDGVRPD